MSLLRKKVVPPRAVASELAAYAARIATAGGTIGATSLAAIGGFIQTCQLLNIWDKLVDVGPFAGNQLAAALVKLKYPTGTGLLTNQNFVGGDYTEATGLLGNGATKYLETNITFQDHVSPAYLTMAIYSRTAIVAGDPACALGADNVWLGANHDGGTIDADFSCAENTFPVSGESAAGFYAATVENPEQKIRIYDSSGVIAGPVDAGAAEDNEVFLFARNNTSGAGAEEFWPGRLSFYALGLGMNAAEIAKLYFAVQALQEQLNREV
jgi:hypothetical protein